MSEYKWVDYNFEGGKELIQQYDEARPWRNLAIGIAIFGVYAIALMAIFLIRR